MKFNHLFHISAIIFLTLQGCGSAEKEIEAGTGIRIVLSSDSSTVELQRIPSYAIQELRTDSMKTEQWQDFFAVYEEPSDREMRDFQIALDGTYSVNDSLITFIPTDRFKKGKSYFSRCYARELMQGPEDILIKRDLSPTDDFLEYKFTMK